MFVFGVSLLWLFLLLCFSCLRWEGGSKGGSPLHKNSEYKSDEIDCYPFQFVVAVVVYCCVCCVLLLLFMFRVVSVKFWVVVTWKAHFQFYVLRVFYKRLFLFSILLLVFIIFSILLLVVQFAFSSSLFIIMKQSVRDCLFLIVSFVVVITLLLSMCLVVFV